MADEYLPVRLNTLRAGEPVSFDVYLKISQKFFHYTHRQDEMEGERLKRLKTGGVRKLYIQQKDEDTYLKYLEEGLDGLLDTSKDMTSKGALAHDTMVMAAENAEKTVETKEAFEAQKLQFDKVTEFIISDRHAIKSMLASSGISLDNNHHAATVSSLALALASKTGMTDKLEIFELGTAALLHDIGKNRQKELDHKLVSAMTPTELKKFKQHPQESVDMLAGKPYISPRILGLVLSHEEYGEGKGFPEKKNLFKQPLAYQILSLVNKFEQFATQNNLALFAAVDPFFEKHGEDFEENLITVLASILT